MAKDTLQKINDRLDKLETDRKELLKRWTDQRATLTDQLANTTEELENMDPGDADGVIRHENAIDDLKRRISLTDEKIQSIQETDLLSPEEFHRIIDQAHKLQEEIDTEIRSRLEKLHDELYAEMLETAREYGRASSTLKRISKKGFYSGDPYEQHIKPNPRNITYSAVTGEVIPQEERTVIRHRMPSGIERDSKYIGAVDDVLRAIDHDYNCNNRCFLYGASQGR